MTSAVKPEQRSLRILDYGDTRVADVSKRLRAAGLQPVLTVRYDPESSADQARLERIVNRLIDEGTAYQVLDDENGPSVGFEMMLGGAALLLVELPRQVLWRLNRHEGGYRE